MCTAGIETLPDCSVAVQCTSLAEALRENSLQHLAELFAQAAVCLLCCCALWFFQDATSPRPLAWHLLHRQ